MAVASSRRLGHLAQHLLAAPVASEASTPRGVLEGIRVIELATVVAAPTACAYLCDMGASVIKIEAPDAPDMTRGWGGGDDPELTAQPELFAELQAKKGKGGGGSAFVQINRGKRSLLLDIRKPAGTQVLKRLLATADVFVSNVRVQSLKKLGLDYESLAPEFPRLIYAHLSAFGTSGPKANDPGYDYASYWAHTGFMDLVRSSEVADMPRFPGAIGDNSTAVHLAGYIGLALFHRERTGKGQLVEAALMRSGIAALAQPLSQYAGGNGWGRSQGPLGVRETTQLGVRNTRLTAACYKCKCGTWMHLAGEDFGKHFKKTLETLGLTVKDVFGEERPKEVPWDHATRVVDGVMATKTYDEWHRIFEEKDVWHQKIQKFEVMFEDEQAKSSGIFVSAPGVRHPLIGSPVLLSAHKAEPRTGAPAFGEHTGAVLTELGLSPQEVEKLKADKVIG
mmetsp:Transcript_51693/g.117116  ORF Transcript_51693/g.117116 Transcript_51693/m.117116 type:complete len:451 (-) Transcript_51693:90-1442(-)